MRAPRIAVVGNLARDLVGGSPPRVGGGPYWAARALHLIGAPAVVVARCAEPDRDVLLPPVLALGTPVRWRPSSATSTFAIDYDGDSRRMRVEGVGDPWQPEDVDGWVTDAIAGASWLHVPPLFRSDFPAETLAALADHGRRILLDGQGLVRRPQTGELVEDGEYDPEVLRHVSVLKLSETEAAVVLPEVSEEAVFALGVPEVLVTLGSRGSIVFAQGRSERIPTTPIDTPDPTGAGDGYSVAYIAARAAGASPWAAARRATTAAVALISRARL
jgi:sugar/nucleoside kinase (ribokinase family)